VYVRTSGLAPVLPLALGRLWTGHPVKWAGLYLDGLRQAEQGGVLFNDHSLEDRFYGSVLGGPGQA
jgi:hypothetical protein